MTPGNQPPNRANALHPENIVEIERSVLRAICAFSGDATQRDHLLKKLANYSWREPDHAVVYRAIRSLPAGNVAKWREELPAAATRMGFPDLNWEYYFGAEDTVNGDVERAISRLFKTGKDAE